MLKTDPKKVPSQKYGFACSSRYNDLTFYEKKIPTSQSLKEIVTIKYFLLYIINFKGMQVCLCINLVPTAFDFKIK